MGKYKAVILDIDGTLVPVGKTGISDRTVQTVNTLRQAKIPVIVATGRCGFVLNPKLLGNFWADYFICVGGSMVMDSKRNILWERRLTLAQMEQLQTLCEEKDFILAYTFEDGYYVYRKFNELIQLARTTPLPEDPGDMDPIGDGPLDGYTFAGGKNDRHLTSMPYGAVLHGVPSTIQLPQGTDLSYTMFHPGSYDVCRADLDKARTTDWLLSKLGLTIKDCVAIGDGNNDVPMLRAAGLGVAMGNARPAAKAAADLITGTVEEDGAAQILEQLFSELF